MLVRSAIAAIDFNANLNRKPKMTADGRRRYKMKVSYKRNLRFNYIFHSSLIHHFFDCVILSICQVDRTGSKVTIVEQMEDKNYAFMTNIFDLCVDCLEKEDVPCPEV